MDYDLFICHASEDKDEIVRPLAELLRTRGRRVWIDEGEIKLGDSLRQKIDEGLARSRFGLVVLSPAFFGKRWPRVELDGLAMREIASGEKVVLPVWHQVTLDDVLQYSPALAGRLAGRTEDGLTTIAEMIDQVFTPIDEIAAPIETPSPPREQLSTDLAEVVGELFKFDPKKIRVLREAQEMSIEELARESGESTEMLSMAESGGVHLTLLGAKNIVDALNRYEYAIYRFSVHDLVSDI